MAKGNLPQKVDEVLIQVSDVRRSVNFYRDGLGIALKATKYGDNSFEANVGGARFLVHPDLINLSRIHVGVLGYTSTFECRTPTRTTRSCVNVE
jgi:hypothetical protein